MGNEAPQIDVANSFITGGNGMGNELRPYASLRVAELHLRFARLSHHPFRLSCAPRRRPEQQSHRLQRHVQFLGGVEPVLDAGNQIATIQTATRTTALTSLQQYQRNLALAHAGFTPSADSDAGRRPFAVHHPGRPVLHQQRFATMPAPFVQDDWRMRPNLTLSLGLRYEVQTLVSDYRDWAPRVGFAWAPGSARNGRQKTVIRGGIGHFLRPRRIHSFRKRRA